MVASLCFTLYLRQSSQGEESVLSNSEYEGVGRYNTARNVTRSKDICFIEHGEKPLPLSAESPPTSCNQKSLLHCSRKFGRALVIYMLHTNNPKTVVHEMENFHFFLQHGVLDSRTSTGLFEGVDYVFVRGKPATTGVPPEVKWDDAKTESCAREENISFLWISNLGSDLCAFAKLFDEAMGGIGVISSRYSYVVLMNAGARGPFVSKTDTFWIDTFAAGGKQNITHSSDLSVSGPTISSEISIHVQSYTIGVPTTNNAFQLLHEALQICRTNPTKPQIIIEVEVALGLRLLDAGVPLFSLSRRHLVTDRKDAEEYATQLMNWTSSQTNKRSRGGNYVQQLNPTFHDVNPCAAVFVKYGGMVLAVGGLPDVVSRRVEQLTMLQQSSPCARAGELTAKKAMSTRSCEWLQMVS